MASPKHRLISLAYIQWLATRSGTGVTVASPKHRLISLAYIQWLATRERDGCYSGFTQTQNDFSCIHTVTSNTRVGWVLQWLHPNTDWFLLHTYSDWQHENRTGVTVASPKHRLISLAYIQWLATRSGTGVTVASPKHRLISLAYIQWLATREWDGCYSGFTQTQIDFSCIHTVTSNTRAGRVLQWLHPNTDWFLLHTCQWLATRERDGCYSGFTQTQIDFSCIHTVTGNTRAGRVLQWLHPNTDWFLLHTYSD